MPVAAVNLTQDTGPEHELRAEDAMAEYKITHEIHHVNADLGEKLKATTIAAINESSARSAKDAALVLKKRLAEIGVDMSDLACLSAVERIRSGRTLTFEVESAEDEDEENED